MAPGRFEWACEVGVLFAVAKRRFFVRAQSRRRDFRRASAVVFRLAKRRFPPTHHVARNCWLAIARGARAFRMVARSCCSGHRREAAVCSSIEEMEPRHPPSIGGLDFGASLGANLLVFLPHVAPGGLNGRARRRSDVRPKRGAATSASQRRLCLGARGGVCALARKEARNCCFSAARGARALRMVARRIGSGSRR